MDAIETSGVGGMGVSDDGRLALIQFDRTQGPLTVTIPSGGLHALAGLALQMSEEVTRKNGERVLQVFDVARWETIRANDGHVILSFVLPTGAHLSFRLHPVAANQLANTLSSEADAVDLPPDTTRN
jgi:hypothetical protein